MNDSVVLRMIFQSLEASPRSISSIDALARGFSIRRRGVYDFVTICSVFGLCKRISANEVDWIGASQATERLNSIRREAEQEPRDKDVREVFNYSSDGSLQRIATGLIKLFFFLRVKFLDVRQVSRFFAQRTTKYKTMLRKVYTAATSLEIAGFVKKTTVVSEIQLNAPLDLDVSERPLNVPSILNSQEQIERARAAVKRRKAFEAICAELRDAQRHPEVPDRVKSLITPIPRWE
jgi:hypothetical protein